MKIANQLLEKHKQLIIYGLIGVTGATLDFLLYYVFYHIFGIPPFIASFLSVSAGIVNNFILNARHNFKVNDRLIMRFVNFYLIGLGGAILSSALIILFYNLLDAGPNIAKLLTIPPVVILQFYLNKHLSFSEKRIGLINIKKKGE